MFYRRFLNSIRIYNGNGMVVTIAYTEFQQYIDLHFGKTLECKLADSSTVAVSTPIKVMGFTKSVGLNLRFEKVEGTDLYLSYDGKLGIDMLVNAAISFVKKFVPEKTELVDPLAGNIIKLKLGDIDKLEKVLEKIELKSIFFDQDAANVEFFLK